MKAKIKNFIIKASKNKTINSFVNTLVPFELKKAITNKINGRLVNKNFDQLIKDNLSKYDLLILSSAYPGGKREYGGGFVKSRVQAYAKQGFSCLVVELSNLNQEIEFHKLEETDCIRMTEAAFEMNLFLLAKHSRKFLIHSGSPELLHLLPRFIAPKRCIYWFHGFDVRDYRRLYFNYTTEEMALDRAVLDKVNRERKVASQKCFLQKNSKKVFVSNFLKTIAERDVACTPYRAYVIPNFIDGDFYQYQPKRNLCKKVLLIRSFERRNYANDIAIDAILELRDRPGFEDLEFTICGVGKYFKPLTDKLEGLKNVVLKNRYLEADEIKEEHSKHGVFLVPSRFDTQGVSMGEAMASGLVCITNNVAAIPEYTDSNSAILVRDNDPVAYAEALWSITHDPDRLESLSVSAAERVRHQCGFDQTIKKELTLLK